MKKPILWAIALPAPLFLYFCFVFLREVYEGLKLSKQDMCQSPLWYGFLGWILIYDLFCMVLALIVPFVYSFLDFKINTLTVSAFYGYCLLILLCICLIEKGVTRLRSVLHKLNSRVSKTRNTFVAEPKVTA